MEVVRNLMILAVVKYVDSKSGSVVIHLVYYFTIYAFCWFFLQYVTVVLGNIFPKLRPTRQMSLFYYMSFSSLISFPMMLVLNFGLIALVSEIAAIQWPLK